MPVRTFIPKISVEEINEARSALKDAAPEMRTNEDVKKAYRAEFSNNLKLSAVIFTVGVLGILLSVIGGSAVLLTGSLLAFGVSIFILVFGATRQARPIQNDPASVAINFYLEAFTVGNYGKAYEVLAPSVTKRSPATSVSELEKYWKDFVDSLKLAVKESVQKTARCSVCDKEGLGVLTSTWGQIWNLDDTTLLINSRNDFLFCDACNAAYCVVCFCDLKKQRLCKNCDSPLKDKSLDILLTDPSEVLVNLEVSTDPRQSGISKKSYRDGVEVEKDEAAKLDDVADTTTMIKGPITYSTSWSRRSNQKAPTFLNWLFIFQNVAVRTEDKWYLMAAVPGEFSDKTS